MPRSPKYGWAHRQARTAWEPTVATGTVNCWRCGERIKPTDAWDLGHAEEGRGYRGPEHRGCNRGAGGRRGGQSTLKRRQREAERLDRW